MIPDIQKDFQTTCKFSDPTQRRLNQPNSSRINQSQTLHQSNFERNWARCKKGTAKCKNQHKDSQQQMLKDDEYVESRRLQVSIFNFILSIYSLIVILQDFTKIAELEDSVSDSSSGINNYTKTPSDNADHEHQDSQQIHHIINNRSISVFVCLASAKVVALFLQVIASTIQILRPKIFSLCLPYQVLFAVVLFGITTHLYAQVAMTDIILISVGHLIVLPYVLLSVSENWLHTFLLYCGVSIYPFYLCICYEEKVMNSGVFLSQADHFFVKKAVPIAIFIILSLSISLIFTQKTRHDLYLQKKQAKVIMKEYGQILEKMPEGILIVDENGCLLYANSELREVMSMQERDKGKEAQGLYIKMFKSYNLSENDLVISDDVDLNQEECEQNCLHTLIEDDNWQQNQERLYELEICGCEPPTEEDRVYTQIRKMNIEFREKPATMLLIRNITHIIKYEKQKNEGLYQELLTGTMSHEMLTPLNTIINLSSFVEMKLQKQLSAVQKDRDKHLQVIINQGREQVQGQNAYLDQGNNQNKQPTQIKSDESIILQEINIKREVAVFTKKCQENEKEFQNQIEYLHMVRSSANILQYLVKELIDVSNIKQDRFTENVIQHDVNQIFASCEEIIDCYRVQAKEKNIYLILSSHTNKNTLRNQSNLYFDRQRYQQILINLVQNGVKFTPLGGVEIIVDVEPYNGIALGSLSNVNLSSKFINIPSKPIKPFNPNDILSATNGAPIVIGEKKFGEEICNDCGLLITRVKDSGIGMRQEVVENLFKLFGNANGGRRAQKKGIITTQGVGLGLSISKQLVEKLGGKIKINTIPNQGTEVTFSIPYKCQTCYQSHHQALMSPFSGGIESAKQIFLSNANNNSNQIQALSSMTPGEAILQGSRGSGRSMFQGANDFEEHSGSLNISVSNKPQIADPYQFIKRRQPFGGDFSKIIKSHKKKTSLTKKPGNNSKILKQAPQDGVMNEPLHLDQPSALDSQMIVSGKNSRGIEQLPTISVDKSYKYMVNSNVNINYDQVIDELQYESSKNTNNGLTMGAGIEINPRNVTFHGGTPSLTSNSRHFKGISSCTTQQLDLSVHARNALQLFGKGGRINQQEWQINTDMRRGEGEEEYKMMGTQGRKNINRKSTFNQKNHKQRSFQIKVLEADNESSNYRTNDVVVQLGTSNIDFGGDVDEGVAQNARGQEFQGEWKKNNLKILDLKNSGKFTIGGPRKKSQRIFYGNFDNQMCGEVDQMVRVDTSAFTMIMNNKISDDGSQAIKSPLEKERSNLHLRIGLKEQNQERLHISIEETANFKVVSTNQESEKQLTNANLLISDFFLKLPTGKAAVNQQVVSANNNGQDFPTGKQVEAGDASIAQGPVIEKKNSKQYIDSAANSSIRAKSQENQQQEGCKTKSNLQQNALAQQQEDSKIVEEDLDLLLPSRLQIRSISEQSNDNCKGGLCHCQQSNTYEDDEPASILLVDDNMFNLIPLELILNEYFGGLKCDKALNGLEAVKLFKKSLEIILCPSCQLPRSHQSSSGISHYKIIFMDIQMPVMDGYEATRQILKIAQPDFPIVAVTSFLNDEAVKTCYKAGMVHVMHKPVNIEQIKAALDKYYYPQVQREIAGGTDNGSRIESSYQVGLLNYNDRSRANILMPNNGQKRNISSVVGYPGGY